jgi:DNA-binding MarR family transcriptional regulator
MPEHFYPAYEALVPFYEALVADDRLNSETKKVGKTFAMRFRSTTKWMAIKQSELRGDMEQPNVSRAIRRLVKQGYLERERSKDSQRECVYRVGDRFRK